jgi:hypothetical protein
LRKYLIVAVAALLAVAVTAVSSTAQSADTFTVKTTVKPKKAGTKTNPKNSTLELKVVNGNTKKTMSDLDIYLPKSAKVSLKGLPSCANADIGTPKCATKVVGTGEAKALVGVDGPAPQPITFVVTAYKTKSVLNGKDMLGFFIDGPGGLDFLTETQLKKASGKYGQRLHIDVPEAAQRTGASSFNGLVSLQIGGRSATGTRFKPLGKKSGNNKLIATTNCVNKKHPFKTVLTFIENEVTRPDKLSKTSTSRCTK